MIIDSQYAKLPRPSGGVDHSYGDRVHLLSYPYPMSLLTRLCSEETQQPMVNHLVSACYDWLLGEVASRLLRTAPVAVPTRMRPINPEGVYHGEAVAERQRVVVVDIARAGILPAHRLYQGLHLFVDPRDLRQDHIVASRTTDDKGAVSGVKIDSSKIGGPANGATVLIPDPMAATGTSLAAVAKKYLNSPDGPPREIAAIHLIVTPEYLKRVTQEFPQMHIFAIRLDRGLSHPDVLKARPGDRWDEEVGLNDTHYIVPGAGGVGEVLNNAWI